MMFVSNANYSQSLLLIVVAIVLGLCVADESFATPYHRESIAIPYQRVEERPANNPYCQALYPFCPNQTAFPAIHDTDEIEVWGLQAPIWEFKFGDLTGKLFHGYHDALGFKNRRTGMNYTMEWYELDQLLNCTFPHLVENSQGEMDPLWCNQGAACFYDGIDDRHWYENGIMDMIFVINGSIFNDMAQWVRQDNNTAPYYISWGAVSHWDDDYFNRTWLTQAFDCASFVLRVQDYLYSRGAVFDASLPTPKYDFALLFADDIEPVDFESDRDDIVAFYSNFQPHQSWPDILKDVFRVVVEDVLWEKKFFLYYNSKYWKLRLKAPYFSLKYAEVPYPGTVQPY